MSRTSLLLAAVSAIAIGALPVLAAAGAPPGPATDEPTAPIPGVTPGTESSDAPAEAMPVSTSDYVLKAAMTDMFEIQAAQVATERSGNAEVKEFAKTMVTDHTATTEKLKPLAAGAGVTLPTELDAEHAALLATLKASSADTFDQTYATQQVAGHEKALALHSGYASSGTDAGLKAFAAETAPKVKMHLEHARALDKSHGR